MLKIFSRIILSVVAASTLITTHAWAAEVVGVLDGDTIAVLESGKRLRIRLASIDAPEKKQAFGQASKKSLSDLCFGINAAYVVDDIDRYGRTVATVTCRGINANKAQVERGMAWVYTKYNKDANYIAVESLARSTGSGLWADTAPIPPWEYRRSNKYLR